MRTVDFLKDRTGSGSKLWILRVTDEFTRESLAIEIGARMPATKVREVLGQVIAERRTTPSSLGAR